MRTSVPFLLAATALFGCRSGKPVVLKDPGPPAMANGWTVATSRDNAVSVGMAPGWGKSEPGILPSMTEQTGKTPTPALEGMSKELESMHAKEDEEQAQRLEMQGVVLTVYQQGVRPVVGEEVTRYYVTRRHVGGAVSMEQATDSFKSVSGKPKEHEVVRLPIGDASLYKVTKTLRDGGILNYATYVIPSKEDVFNVIFITENDPASINQIRDAVMKTLRIRN